MDSFVFIQSYLKGISHLLWSKSIERKREGSNRESESDWKNKPKHVRAWVCVCLRLCEGVKHIHTDGKLCTSTDAHAHRQTFIYKHVHIPDEEETGALHLHFRSADCIIPFSWSDEIIWSDRNNLLILNPFCFSCWCNCRLQIVARDALKKKRFSWVICSNDFFMTRCFRRFVISPF